MLSRWCYLRYNNPSHMQIKIFCFCSLYCQQHKKIIFNLMVSCHFFLLNHMQLSFSDNILFCMCFPALAGHPHTSIGWWPFVKPWTWKGSTHILILSSLHLNVSVPRPTGSTQRRRIRYCDSGLLKWNLWMSQDKEESVTVFIMRKVQQGGK